MYSKLQIPRQQKKDSPKLQIPWAIEKNTSSIVFPYKANKNTLYICPFCREDIIWKQGKIYIPHFSHKTYNSENESKEHKQAKLLLCQYLDGGVELKINKLCENCKCVTTDFISKTNGSRIVPEHTFDSYGENRRADVAYLQSDGQVGYIFEILQTHKTDPDRRKGTIWYEFSAKEVIEKFCELDDKKQIQLTCLRDDRICDVCSPSSYYDNANTEDYERKGKIFINQRGAGNGKTYESIQLLCGNNSNFQHKQRFIYLTKMHSAKDVIFKELKEQESSGKLTNLIISKNKIDNNPAYYKQYLASYTNTKTKIPINAIIGTIDSFTCAVASEKPEGANFFAQILENIINGNIKDKIKYRTNVTFDKSCLIIIDEAQDLQIEYLKAMSVLVKNHALDVYIIGDKLQSIFGENNIMTNMLGENPPDLDVEFEINSGENIVRRFHNEGLSQLANKVVNFEKHGMGKITGICPGCCEYGVHKNDQAYELFSVPEIYNEWTNSKNEALVDKCLSDIIEYMRKEVEENKYLPEDFAFLFPVLSGNHFAHRLEERVQHFWVEMFSSSDYKKMIQLSNNNKYDYWKKESDQFSYNYSHLHKSEEGKPINLSESIHSTRIMSIHAAKGTGTEVVFLLRATEEALKLFSCGDINIVYESLWHVAVTRSKQKLYIGLENYDDDIGRRFSDDDKQNLIPHLPKIKSLIKFKDLIKPENNTIYKDFCSFVPLCCCDMPYEENARIRNVIDWNDHVYRFAIISITLLFAMESDPSNKGSISQIRKIMETISDAPTVLCYGYPNYYKNLKHLSKDIKHNKRLQKDQKDQRRKLFIPLLSFAGDSLSGYSKQAEKLSVLVGEIQVVIRQWLDGKEMDKKLNPLQYIIIYFMQEMCGKGLYSEISITNLFRLMEIYDPSCKPEAYKKMLQTHYESVEKVINLYKEFKKHLERLTSNPVNYNISHVLIKDKNNLQLINTYEIIGYNDDCVIYMMIKPQLTKLNYSDTSIEIMTKAYSVHLLDDKTDISEKNYKKFANKPLCVFVFTLDLDGLMCCEPNITTILPELQHTVKSAMTKHLLTHENKIYQYFRYLDVNNQDLSSDDREKLIPRISEYMVAALVNAKNSCKEITRIDQDIIRAEASRNKIKEDIGKYKEDITQLEENISQLKEEFGKMEPDSEQALNAQSAENKHNDKNNQKNVKKLKKTTKEIKKKKGELEKKNKKSTEKSERLNEKDEKLQNKIQEKNEAIKIDPREEVVFKKGLSNKLEVLVDEFFN
jgi:hypothetical protein